MQFTYLKITGPTEADWTVKTREVMSDNEQLRLIQAELGGYMEVHPLTPELALLCNEDGKALQLKGTVAWLQKGLIKDIVVGSVMVVRVDPPDMISLNDGDLPIIKQHLRPLRR